MSVQSPQAPARTEAEKAALAAVQELTGADSPMERHGIRVFTLAEPRDGFYAEIGRKLAKAGIERPLSLPRIFLRGG